MKPAAVRDFPVLLAERRLDVGSLHRLGEDAARTFRLLLTELARLELLAIDSVVHEAIGRKLERLRGHKLSHVDASSLVLLERHRIGEVWQPVVNVWRRTETGEAPRRQGATTENTGSI